MLPEDLAPWLDTLGETRLKILAALPAGGERKQLLHQLVRRDACDPDDCPFEQKLNEILSRSAEETDNTHAARAGTVYLTGAGPGAPDLLTLRAHSLICTASCILYDDLVPTAIVELARPDALIVNVGKRCGQKLVTQEQIHAWMIEYAQTGHGVVRLKGGDPMLFGRAAEEIAALTQAGIPFEVVSGVSAALAAAGAAGVSLTDRDSSSRVVLTTRHRAGNEMGGVSAVDAGSTLALYMPGKNYAALQSELEARGWPPDTACVIVSGASLPTEKIARTRLGELGALNPLPAPAVLLILPSATE